VSQDWKDLLKRFESFLSKLNLKKYDNLREIKTVEQDLPRNLNPLPIIYEFYWDNTNFVDYDEMFEEYWRRNFTPDGVWAFVKKFFYGCSLSFVQEGFKARIYRTWMSLLTQFHFQYLWNAEVTSAPLESSAELDMDGIDGVIKFGGKKIAIQIKKVSFRREASGRRFASSKRKEERYELSGWVEVPYLVEDLRELRRKQESARCKEETRERAKKILAYFGDEGYFQRLSNGFIIFRPAYVHHVWRTVCRQLKVAQHGKLFRVRYEEILPLW